MDIRRITDALNALTVATRLAASAFALLAATMENRKPVKHDPACERFLLRLYRKPRNRLRSTWSPPPI
jgi:hypothetical protein